MPFGYWEYPGPPSVPESLPTHVERGWRRLLSQGASLATHTALRVERALVRGLL